MYRNGCRKRVYPTSSTPCTITRPPASHLPKRRRLIPAELLHSRSVSPVSDTHRPVSPSSVSPRPVSPSSVSPRPVSPTPSVGPDRPGVSSTVPGSAVRGTGRGKGRGKGKNFGVRGPSEGGRGKRKGQRGKGKGRGGKKGRDNSTNSPAVLTTRGRGDPDNSATSPAVLDSSTTTPASKGKGKGKDKKPPPPNRRPSKDTPTDIRIPPKHPFTEEVGPTQPLPESANALDFFMQMFDQDLMEHIVAQTNLYATTRDNHRAATWTDMTVPEFKSFLGTMMLMGITQLPHLHNYWSTNGLLGAPHVVQAFPRDRFMRILRELHFNDNTTAVPRGQPGYDRAHKVRPVIDSISEKCLTLYKPHKENSVDEAMVKFKGRSSLKQFMPKKPIKRGYKVWCRCDSHNGFTCCFQVYLGKTDSPEKDLGIRATLDMTQDIFDKGYHIYCDNFFSCPQLCVRLEEKKTYCIGTVRNDRVGFTRFNKQQKKALKKGEDLSNVEYIRPLSTTDHSRSEVDTSCGGNVDDTDDDDDANNADSDEVSSIVSTDEVHPPTSSAVVPSSDDTSSSPAVDPRDDPNCYPVHCFCWRDRKHVYFVNNVTMPWEVTTVNRKQKDGTSVAYPCPLAVDLYNKYMGGVDMADAMRRLYSTSRKSKHKWYMRLFWFLLDTCIVNAYILQCESPNHRPTHSIGKKRKQVFQTQLDFVLELAGELVTAHNSRKRIGRPTIMPRNETRVTKHVPFEYDAPRQCKVCSSKQSRKRTKYGCAECGVPLCITPCFGTFHR